MEILNLKVVNKYWFSKLFKFKVSNFDFITVNGNKCVANFKIACSYPALAVNIEWVVCGCINCFAIRSGNVKNFVSFLNPNVENLFKLCFARFGIVCPNTVANLNFFNAYKSVRSIYLRVTRETGRIKH